MRCVRCSKYISKAAAYFGGQPVGPVCAQKLGIQLIDEQKPVKPSHGIANKRVRIKQTQVVRSDQIDLF